MAPPQAAEVAGGHPAPTAGQATKLILALPKGRILKEVVPLVQRAGIEPEPGFFDPQSRALRFATNHPDFEIILVRSFDVATFVAFGAAQLGYPDLYAPVDLRVGRCRIAVAEPAAMVAGDDPARWSHVRIATKYPEIARRHFAARGVQAECIKLSGAVELAPMLSLCRRIVDLVSTGATLKAHDLVEVEHIADVTSRLVVNRAALKTFPDEVGGWIERFREAVDGA